MSLTLDQSAAFSAWLESEQAKLSWPDGNNVAEIARSAFEAGIHYADNAPALRYDAQYRRRFLGGSRLADRERREGTLSAFSGKHPGG